MPTHDECIVDAEPLARLVTGFVDRWEHDRPAPVSRYGRNGSAAADCGYMDALTWLATESGVLRKTIANLAGTSEKNISIKATTTEQMGFVGRKEGLVAYATVLLETI